jgi:hypothetical protein
MAIAGKLVLGGAEFCQPCVRYLRSDFLKYIVTSVNARFFAFFSLIKLKVGRFLWVGGFGSIFVSTWGSNVFYIQ